MLAWQLSCEIYSEFMALIQTISWNQFDSDELVYKFPSDSITMGSVLTVNESQMAFLYKSGALYDSFGAGRHVLTTENIPLIQKIINLPSGRKTTFTSEVWFVSKLEKRNMLWGAGGLRVLDPYYRIPIKLSARGQYGIRICDPTVFLKKFVGTMDSVSTDFIEDQFVADVVEVVKVAISKFMQEKNVSVNELGCSYKELSNFISQYVDAAFELYGVGLLNFNIEDISFDENDSGYKKVMDGIAERVRLENLGINYMQSRQLDIAHAAAQNEGAGNFMGIGMGLGMGNSLGQCVGNAIQSSGVMPTATQLLSFYVAVNGQTTGPFTMDVIQNKIMSGEIVAKTYVYKVGGSAWVRACEALELASYFGNSVPPPPPPPCDM